MSTEDPPDAQERSSERRIALFGMAAALAGAVIGALGAGVPVIIAANSQIDADQRLATSEFLRERQQAAYSDFILVEDALAATVRDFFEVETRGGSNFEYRQRYEDNLSSFLGAYSNVALIGSQAARGRAELIQEVHMQELSSSIDQGVRFDCMDSETYPRSDDPCFSVYSNLIEHLSQLHGSDGLLREFIDQGRSDLGAR